MVTAVTAATAPPIAATSGVTRSRFWLIQLPAVFSQPPTVCAAVATVLSALPNAVPAGCPPVIAFTTAMMPVHSDWSPPPTDCAADCSEVNAPVSLTWPKNVCNPWTPVVARLVTAADAALMPPVTAGLNRLNASVRPPVTAASRFPMAPSMVLVDVAACFATSVMPRSMSALLNSTAVISPLDMASRKLPVYAPFFSSASWSLPDAPGMASASWFQFSVVNFPAPAVWVSIIATLLKLSALPPATALRLPAASVSSM